MNSYGNKGHYVFFSQLLVLLVCTLITSINVAVYSLLGAINTEYIKSFNNDIVKMNLLDIMLLSVTAVFIGLLISKLKNRFSGYSVLAIVLICVSPAVNMVLIELNRLNVPLYKLRDILNFIPPDLNSLTDKLYGYPLEMYRFALMLFWILLSILIYVWQWLKNNRTLRTVICGILSIAIIGNAIMYIDRGSVAISYKHPEAATESVYDYYSNITQKQEKADFNIEMYDMKFTIDNRLRAIVNMKIEKPAKENSYHFTLYHNYKIKNISDENNNSLHFEQNGDYFEVFKPDGKDIEHIKVEYSGFSEAFYSSNKAVFLPGFFAFYPQPGYNTVFSLKEYKYISSDNEPSEFKVDVSAKDKITSNLEGDGKSFNGVAQNLTLVGGYFEESIINNFEVVTYPLDVGLKEQMNKISSHEYRGKVDKAKMLLGETSDVSFTEKKIITVPHSLTFNSVVADVYTYEDSIIINPYNIEVNEYDFFNIFIPETIGKQNLKQCFFDRLKSEIMSEKVHLYSENGSNDISAQVSDTLVLKLQEFGAAHVAPIVYQYLKDETNTED